MEVYVGNFWCFQCAQRTDHTLVEGESTTDPEAPLECYVCGAVRDKVVQEVDPVTGAPYAVPRTLPSISREARDTERTRIREEFRANVLSNGVRLENFSHARRGVNRG
jgi:hypothetical protein